MATHFTQGQNQQQAQQAQQQQAQQQYQQPQDAGQGAGFVFGDLFGTGSSLFAPTGSSEALDKVEAAISGFMVKKGGGKLPQDWTLVKIEAAANGLPASVLAVVAVARVNGQARAYVTNLMLEATAVNLSKTELRTPQRTFAITTTLGQAFNDQVWAIIRRRVAEAVGIGQEAVLEVSTLVVPRDYNLVEQDSLIRLVYLATVASSIGQAGGPATKMQLSMADLRNQRFTTRVDFSGTPKIDMLGRPVRNDLCVTTHTVSEATQGQQFQSENKILELSAFVELNYVQPQALQGPYPGAPVQVATQQYRPEIVLTDLRSNFLDFDLSRALFCLTSVGALERGYQWLRAFQFAGSGRKNAINLRDIGAIGYELEVTGGKAIPTGRDQFSTADLQDVVQRYFHQQPLISVDIDPNGQYNWVMNDFLTAGQTGTAAAAAAANRIIAAARTLTTMPGGGNTFDNHWKGGVDICETRHVVAAGHYTNDANEVRDLAEIDYLAMLNIFGGTDPESFKRWAKTYEDQAMPEIERLAEREDLLRQRLSSVEITGYKRRVTFNKAFLIALEAAMVECGYHPTPDSLSPVFGPQAIRGTAGLDRLATGQFGQTMYAGQTTTTRGGNLGGRATSFGN